MQAACNPDLLCLLSVAAELGNVWNRTQLILNSLDVAFQLPVTVAVPVHGHQERDGVAEIGIDDWSHHSWRKFSLGASFVEIVPEFGPKFVGILHAVLQLDIDEKKSRAAGRIRLLLANLGKLE